jgi:hypothetical protein
VGAEHGGEGCKLGPAHEKLFRAVVLQQGVIYGRIPADVGVLEAKAGKSA